MATHPPRFQQRHYEFLADWLREELDRYRADHALDSQALIDAIDRLIPLLQADNPAFNPSRFLAACGLGAQPRGRKDR